MATTTDSASTGAGAPRLGSSVKILDGGGAGGSTANLKAKRAAEEDADAGYAQQQQQQYTAADVERRIDALHEAARTGGNLRAVGGKFLRVQGFVDAADPYGWTPLMVAAREGHEQTCLDLLKFGANVNAKDEFGTTSLMLAARHGLIAVCRDLLRLGADVNAVTTDGASALMMAAWKGREQICLELLAKSASVNITSNDGKTPLMVAAENGLGDVCLDLVERGADVNVKIPQTSSFYPDWTPLMFAAEKGLSTICMKLLACGANCNAVSQGGSTPLMIAAESGLEDVCLELIRLGSDMDYRDNYGKNAPAHAKQGGYARLGEYLEALSKGLRRAGVTRVGPNVDLTRPLVMVAQNASQEAAQGGRSGGSSSHDHHHHDASFARSGLQPGAWEQSFKALLRVGADIDAALLLAAIKVGDEVARNGQLVSAAEMISRVKRTLHASMGSDRMGALGEHGHDSLGMLDDNIHAGEKGGGGQGGNVERTESEGDFFQRSGSRVGTPSTAIQYLLRNGGNLLSAVAETIRFGLVGACSVLMALGDPDLTSPFRLPQCPDADGHTPICYALRGCTMTHAHPARQPPPESDRVEVVIHMIEIIKSRVLDGGRGLDKAKCVAQCALLPIAAKRTTADVVQNLLAAGADVHEKNESGETAMVAMCKHAAALSAAERKRNEERASGIIGMLLKWHANVDDTDAKGTSARHYLRTCNYPAVEAQIDDMDRERVRRNLPELGSQVEQVLREMKSLRAQVASQARELQEQAQLRELVAQLQGELQSVRRGRDDDSLALRKRLDEQDKVISSLRQDLREIRRKEKTVEEAASLRSSARRAAAGESRTARNGSGSGGGGGDTAPQQQQQSSPLQASPQRPQAPPFPTPTPPKETLQAAGPQQRRSSHKIRDRERGSGEREKQHVPDSAGGGNGNSGDARPSGSNSTLPPANN